jgi:hypothetical protein
MCSASLSYNIQQYVKQIQEPFYPTKLRQEAYGKVVKKTKLRQEALHGKDSRQSLHTDSLSICWARRAVGSHWLKIWGKKVVCGMRKSCQRLVASLEIKFFVILVCFAFQILRECLRSDFSYGNEKIMSLGAWLVDIPSMLCPEFYCYFHVTYLE